MLIAAVVMGCLLFPQRKALKKSLHGQKTPLYWSFFSGVFFFFHLWTFFLSAKNTSVANATVLFATNPAFTALLSIFFFRKTVPRLLWLADLLAFSGIVLLVHDKLNLQSLNNIGIWSAVLSAILFSGYILTGNKAREGMDNRLYTLVAYTVTGVLFLGTCLYTHAPMWGFSMQTWMAVIGITVFSTLLGHSIFSYLMKFLDINWMSCGKLMEPFLAALSAYFLFGEVASASAGYAFVLIASGILLLFLPRIRSRYFKF